MIAAEWTRVITRLGLVLSLSVAAVAYPITAWADDDDEEEDDDDGGGDDDDGGDDDEEEEEEEEDQPPVTAGGLFTKETYPQAELERPLTITRKMTELRLGIDIDVSSGSAFKNFGIAFDARHGLEDNVELQAGLRSDLNHFNSFSFYAAFEGSIVYDLVDFRGGIVIPYTKTTDMTTGDTTSNTAFDIEFGFPFRYAPKPQVAVIALDTFMTINTSGEKYTVMSGEETIELNSSTPDLTPSIGVIVQPMPMLALILKAKLIIADFNTDADNFKIPVSLNVQFSPKNLLDIGGEFSFPNLKPPEPAKFTDSRFLLLYGQIRI